MFYRIEWCCTLWRARWLYEGGGLHKGEFLDSDNPWEWDDDDVFDNKEDAYKAWRDSGRDETYIWEDYEDGDDPDIGLTLYTLSEYDDDENENVLEYSSVELTPAMIQEMFPNTNFEKEM